MSSSDDTPRAWGAIYRGLETVSLAEVEAEEIPRWTAADEEAYLARVKEKAESMAAELVAAAQAEADSIREAARQEGYNAGIGQAEEELEGFRAAMAESVNSVLTAIEGQCSAIFERWRADLVDLVRACVEKGVGLALTEDKRLLLASLYLESVKALENRRNLVIRVSPDDEPVIADIVALTRDRFPDLTAWSVKADPSMTPGGLTVESEDSLVDNRREVRMAMVGEIMDKLVLPPEA